jgi:hypothetical protein
MQLLDVRPPEGSAYSVNRLSHQIPLWFNIIFLKLGMQVASQTPHVVFGLHLIRNRKSSRALEHKSGTIWSMFWEANRMKVERRDQLDKGF